MTRKTMTPERYQEIKRLLNMGLSVKKICRAMKATKRTIRAIRDGNMPNPSETPKSVSDGPMWSLEIPWEEVHSCASGKDAHPLKFVWEDYAIEQVSYTGFLRQFYKRYPNFKVPFSTLRDIPMGQQCEVDYMGLTPEWVEPKTGEVHKAAVFVGALCGSQLIFASARADATSANFIDCHIQMYAAFGGVPQLTVPDNLKTGVMKPHIFDPSINLSYADMAKHYQTAIIPARVKRPKDKPIVERSVRMIKTLFRWRYRNHTFTSLSELNKAIQEVVRDINDKIHTRFKISRRQLWKEEELTKLKMLPVPYEYFETKKAKVHPDSHIALKGHFYSAPYRFLGRVVTVRFNSKSVKIFYGLDSIAVHGTAMGRKGKRITNIDHLPGNAKAYRSVTPQSILSQARRLSQDLHQLIEGMFQKDTVSNMRRAQGMISETRKEFKIGGSESAEIIRESIEHMLRVDQVRVPVYRELLLRFRKSHLYLQKKNKSIVRNTNPMLRHQQVELDPTKENEDGKHVVH